MRFEQCKDPEDEYPYRLILEDGDIGVVAAAFKEHIYYLASKGNIGSVSTFDEYMADPCRVDPSKDNQSQTKTVRLKDTGPLITEVLIAFEDRTGDAIQGVVEISATPPFMSNEIVLRRQLGRQALELYTKHLSLRHRMRAQPA